MNGTQDDERARRVTLSYASEPGDDITARMIARNGTADTIDAITSSRAPQLRGVEHDAILTWQDGLAKRLQTRTASGVLEACLRHGIRIVIPGDSDWPTQLDDLPNPPVALYVRGDLSPLTRNVRNIVTVVGSRAATGYGEFVTQETVQGLTSDGFTLVSGVAYGIEGQAMRSALATGDAPVAFLAGGLDRPYPAGNQELIDRIAEHGAVVSELPPGMTPTKLRFMQRNRLLAAASAATVVVEAGARSGSLHVAASASRLGREVAAFPGPVTSPNSAGPHRLVIDGVATLVTQAEDIRRLIDHDGPDATPSGGMGSVAQLPVARRSRAVLEGDQESAERASAAIAL